ncbi:GNAT family N-acetyltransferase [Roseibium sp. M-1]
MEIRLWKPGDETAIIELFETVFSRPMSIEYWRWRFLNHPSGGPLVALAWDGDKLAGHYAASQAPLVIDGQIVPAALSTTTMTHPDYRGRRLLERTAECLYEVLASQGYLGVWGFPNQNVNALRQMKLGWFNIDDVPALSCEAGSLPADDPNVVEVDGIDKRFAELAERTCRQTHISALRTTDILKWRVDRNPINSYRLYCLTDGDIIRAYLIGKTYQDTEFDIVEMKADDTRSASSILQSVIGKSISFGISRVNAWCLHADPHRIVYERLGFAAKAPLTYFGGRAFRRLGTDFGDSRMWRLSFLDSDLY